MLSTTVLRSMIGVDRRTVIVKTRFDESRGAFIIAVRQRQSKKPRCGVCGALAPRYDQGEGKRLWRCVDLGTTMAFLEADAPRVSCKEHGVVVASVPWARHDARFTYAYEDTCAWITAHAPASTVAVLMRTTWRSVTAIVERVVAELAGRTDLLDGLRRIGIDEIAHRKGQRYITCVIDHDTGRLVWAREGRDMATLEVFFDHLGKDRSKLLKQVSCDGAEWIHAVVRARAKRARICLDPFHVMQWASKALDEVRREMWRGLRGTPAAEAIKGSRWALLTSPDNQTTDHQGTLVGISVTNKRLYRAYLLKEQLRLAMAVKGHKGKTLLAAWLRWAKRCRIPSFVKLAKTIENYLGLIHNTMTTKLSNARSEATNTHLRVLTRRSYGFHSPEALIAMAMLTRGGLCPPLPGRAS